MPNQKDLKEAPVYFEKILSQLNIFQGKYPEAIP